MSLATGAATPRREREDTMKTTSQNTEPTKTITLGTSQYGNLQPQIEVRMPMGTHYRVAKATLLKLAAELELATPAREGWVVQISDHAETRGWVYLELADGSEAEAARGMELLKSVAG
jgi:hypothetical protein